MSNHKNSNGSVLRDRKEGIDKAITSGVSLYKNIGNKTKAVLNAFIQTRYNYSQFCDRKLH